MAFSATGLQLLSVGAVKVWLYKSADANATVVASGYFNNAVDTEGRPLFTAGDIVYCVLTTGGTVESTLLVITATGVMTTSDNITAT